MILLLYLGHSKIKDPANQDAHIYVLPKTSSNECNCGLIKASAIIQVVSSLASQLTTYRALVMGAKSTLLIIVFHYHHGLH